MQNIMAGNMLAKVIHLLATSKKEDEMGVGEDSEMSREGKREGGRGGEKKGGRKGD